MKVCKEGATLAGGAHQRAWDRGSWKTRCHPVESGSGPRAPCPRAQLCSRTGADQGQQAEQQTSVRKTRGWNPGASSVGQVIQPL